MSHTFTITSEAALTRLVARLTSVWKQQKALGHAVVVTIDRSDDPHTDRQRRRYWALLRQIAEHAVVDGRQYAGEHWDEYYKRLLLGTSECDGETVTNGTSGLTVGQFNDYMRDIEVHAATELHLELDLQ